MRLTILDKHDLLWKLGYSSCYEFGSEKQGMRMAKKLYILGFNVSMQKLEG